MLTAEQMKLLKKVNVSKDVEKTKVRIKEDFKSLSNKTKAAIVELSGLSRHSFYNAFDSGAATPKVILSLAQILDVSPYYYMGAVDEKGSCSDDVLAQFLKDHGYMNLANEVKPSNEIKPKRKYTRRPKVEDVKVEDVKEAEILSGGSEIEADESKTIPFPAAENSNELTQAYDEPVNLDDAELEADADIDMDQHDEVFRIELSNSQKMDDAVARLDEETAIMLLKALYKRAEAGGDAEMICDIVKRCLLA